MDTTSNDGIASERCDGPLGGAQMAFPVTFDLRIIYVLAQGAAIQEDVQAIFARLKVDCSLMQGTAKPDAKYGRFGSRVTLRNRVQFYAVYAEIGKLPYVKAVF